ncbi:Hsp20/alpha crystallin family protein [Geovibrio thiophilus]|uniref:Hsp20/alpha crystallin family protein n=1 Tax=Geovibrio thiophilus TaxID=139438 RepID=A0A3R5XWW5_9BACT|nr:Hsp20/alpha crystallin family protein [Geovibrio thiophilus]QAR33185.1 Hsp20/alpha crystallin family protein [Geovibrio thiophilus]
MAIVRWDPLKDLMAMHDRINKMFNDSFDKQNAPSYGEWMPPVDIYETEDEIVVVSELPGIDENDMDIQVSEGVLTLKGEKKYPLDRESDNYYRLERAYGKFQRSFAVPNTIDMNSIKANLKDGVLKIALKKRAEIKPTVIKVETE